MAFATEKQQNALRTNHGFVRTGGITAWLSLALSLALSPLVSAQEISKEYQIKAVFLWRLAQFVNWPSNAFENEGSPIVIGVYGQNPFGEALNLAVREETAHGRKIVVRQFNRLSEIQTCHILYVPRSEADRARAITAALSNKSILTVSDIPNFAANGGMIRLVSEEGKIRLRVNLDATEKARLNLDARLLRMAEVVRDG